VLFCIAWINPMASAEPSAISGLTRPGNGGITREDVEFFERNIRPVLAEKCYTCHSSKSQKLKGKLLLDSRQGISQGGENGPIIRGRDPDQSRLIQAIRWTDPDLQMPPKEKLGAAQIAALEQWVRMGAPDPRQIVATGSPGSEVKSIDLEQGRQWWAFQPVE